MREEQRLKEEQRQREESKKAEAGRRVKQDNKYVFNIFKTFNLNVKKLSFLLVCILGELKFR